jgi:hypothetical protein
MHKPFRRFDTILLFSLLVFVLLSGGCSRILVRGLSPVTGEPKLGLPATEPNVDTPMTAYQKKINDMLIAKEFAAIESEARSARASKERFRGGFWKISCLYDATKTIYAEYKGQNINDEMWTNRIELLKTWKAEMPNSVTAHIALAGAYLDYAWFARGNGYAGSVSRSDYADMQSRVTLAENELLEAEKLHEDCPRLLSEQLSIATMQGWPRVKFEELFEKAIRKETNYLDYYTEKSVYLKPKWHGEPGDWQKYIDSLPGKLATLNTDEADIIYFVVLASEIDDPSGNNWAMVSKERIKKGSDEIQKRFGQSYYRLNQFAYLASVTGDYDNAKRAFDEIGEKRNNAVWKEQTFNMMKALAENGGPPKR